MPDSNVTLDTRHLADAYAGDLVRELEDSAEDAGESIAVEEWPDVISVTYPDRGMGDLGRVIERSACDDADCEVCG